MIEVEMLQEESQKVRIADGPDEVDAARVLMRADDGER
eukprot:CAMPEP_0198132698 /NCGR_PEP_ID=MMETSP1442-20131203/58911_1 /TAXON_ID= /ORGANISM="Craspedostauros australis, Strain CCMP3328" /LENGTH=37 /DNA_ID= /DNA_START= /DNA_END= /DNA_ORIENTATION=